MSFIQTSGIKIQQSSGQKLKECDSASGYKILCQPINWFLSHFWLTTPKTDLSGGRKLTREKPWMPDCTDFDPDAWLTMVRGFTVMSGMSILFFTLCKLVNDFCLYKTDIYDTNSGPNHGILKPPTLVQPNTLKHSLNFYQVIVKYRMLECMRYRYLVYDTS